jgi:hypothetical protein
MDRTSPPPGTHARIIPSATLQGIREWDSVSFRCPARLGVRHTARDRARCLLRPGYCASGCEVLGLGERFTVFWVVFGLGLVWFFLLKFSPVTLDI